MTQDHNQVLLEWRVHLAKNKPQQLIKPAIATVMGAVIVWQSTHNPLLALLMVVLLVLATAEFLFPVYYRLTEDGIYMRNFLTVRTLPWNKVRRCYRGARGIKLSPLAKADWREGFRGIYLWVEGAQQEQVVELIRAHRGVLIGPAGRSTQTKELQE